MPVRSLKLKIVVPRHPSELEKAQALWSTHRLVNEAVSFYEQKLLLLRGETYSTSDGSVPQDEVRRQLLEQAREAQARNGGSGGSDDEIVRLCRSLYEAIVLADDANAQLANAFLGPLTDPNSAGFLEAFNKVDRPAPSWLDQVPASDPIDPAVLAEANAWLDTDAGRAWLVDTGAPPRWRSLAAKQDPIWPREFARKLGELRKEAASGTSAIIKALKRDFGVLPLFQPSLAPRILGSRSSLTPWDRLAFRLAVGHLLSWESWCTRARDEHTARVQRLEQFSSAHLKGDLATKVSTLREYERARKEQIAQLGLPMGERDFLITVRMTRGWDDLREKWRRSGDKGQEALHAIIATEQTRKRGRFGDPDLFRWLARPENHHVWADGHADAVGVLARVNAMERLVERSRDTALMTLPDPVAHPRSAQWEAEGGSNLRNYQLEAVGGELQITLPLLKAADDGRCIDTPL